MLFCSLILSLISFYYFFLFFKQKTAYEMRISDWSSDVCSSDLCPKIAASSISLCIACACRIRISVCGYFVQYQQLISPNCQPYLGSAPELRDRKSVV